MKKTIAALAAAVIFVTGAISPSAAAETSGKVAPKTGVTINVYNWGEYISNGVDDTIDVNKEFTRRTGIGVNYTTYDSNESLYSKLANGGANYDIIIPSDYMVSKLIQEHMVEKLDFKNIPNFKYIDKRFRNPQYDKTNEYSVPYTWGVVGIFYNKKYVKEPVDSWKILWDKKYAGKILMFDNPRDTFGIAQKRLGYSFNSTNPEEWENAAKLLKEQKPLVQAYVMDQIFDKMSSGDAWLAPYYAGDAATLVKDNPDIGFAIPTKEGTNFFVDAICIPAGSQHKKEAEAYINFLCDPEIAAANMEYIGYSTPESAAKELMPKEMVENPIFYPDENIMKNSETFVNLPEDTNLLLDTLWAEVKMGGPGQSATLVAVLCGFLLLYIGIVVYKKVKAKRELQ
ncbi:spermidine/putrescine ABC transporter substrate-binding protein [Caproiciproducens galactitolivorans]|uniref:Spermidine/putrescine-binding periplasmic protein n=1 Tax=Caproiciproducens galactitolivorans TaxID=642589 RepID=A0A4Z0YFU5_9FIRM|nr:spermidine/putrescine ABC transporter substrate-binding protein [Caproiciproducens galactitolivorans]QEY34415.1 spermidine/putrescine ABC transporter substrate-binding protein [Caproiciproducens galactitolivorans]TGJ77810.1 spermidine/putrescine-binding periplasmic protein precursor [Caproiciproducens galactitolivorans]